MILEVVFSLKTDSNQQFEIKKSDINKFQANNSSNLADFE